MKTLLARLRTVGGWCEVRKGTKRLVICSCGSRFMDLPHKFNFHDCVLPCSHIEALYHNRVTTDKRKLRSAEGQRLRCLPDPAHPGRQADVRMALGGTSSRKRLKTQHCRSDTRIMECTSGHQDVKADTEKLRATTTHLGVQRDTTGEVLLYLRNCHSCGSTLCIEPDHALYQT